MSQEVSFRRVYFTDKKRFWKMNSTSTLNRPSTPTYPNPPKNYYSNTKNNIFSNENIFHACLKEPITRHTHLVHLNKKFIPLDVF